MRKFWVMAILFICVFAVIATPIKGYKKAMAESVSTNRLEYFELDKPIAVDRDGDKIFIAQKNMLIIYHDETYDKINVDNGDVKQLEKCGNHLLFLNGDKLFTLNLATYELSPALFSEVSAFSVFGDFFAINQNNTIRFFKLSDRENFLFDEQQPGYADGKINVLGTTPSTSLAITPELTFYYYAENKVLDMDLNGRQGATFDKSFESVEQLVYGENGDYLYVKSGDNLYQYSFSGKQIELLLDFKAMGIENSSKIAVDGNLLLLCDTQADRVVEFDLTNKTATGFEVSFTKINVDKNFKISYNGAPKYITVQQGSKLYDVKFAQSIEKGYFLFNGYFTQEASYDYLVIGEINDIFYLICGECFALVLKEDYTPQPVKMTHNSKECYLTNDCNIYTYPKLQSEFIDLRLSKHEKVFTLKVLNFNGVDYAIIVSNGKSGFIPTSFLIDEIYVEPEYINYSTATTKLGKTKVYFDKEFSCAGDALYSYSNVIVIEEGSNYYLIQYGKHQRGYVYKHDIIKRGSYTNKIVAVIILLALSLTVTFIHFELKYLYKRKKGL